MIKKMLVATIAALIFCANFSCRTLTSEDYYNRGNAYADKGDYDRAIENYTRAIELNSKNRGHRIVYDVNKAIKDYTKAIELSPKNADTYHCRGLVYYQKGDYDRAIEDFTRTIELNPNDAGAYYSRGLAYALQKMPTLACNDLYKAGILFLKINDRNNLLKCINNMKQADPSSPLIKKLMDRINANPEKKQ